MHVMLRRAYALMMEVGFYLVCITIAFRSNNCTPGMTQVMRRDGALTVLVQLNAAVGAQTFHPPFRGATRDVAHRLSTGQQVRLRGPPFHLLDPSCTAR